MFRNIGTILGGLLIFLGYAAVISLPILIIWKLIIVPKFNAPELNWLEVTLIHIMLKLLFKVDNRHINIVKQIPQNNENEE